MRPDVHARDHEPGGADPINFPASLPTGETHSDVVLGTSTLLGYWRMGAASGSQPDSSPYSYDLSVGNAGSVPGSYDVAGTVTPDDGAFEFKYNQTLTDPAAGTAGTWFTRTESALERSGLAKFSVECFWKQTATWNLADGLSGVLAGTLTGDPDDDTEAGWLLAVRKTSSGVYEPYIQRAYGASVQAVFGDPLVAGVWTHLGATYDGTTLRFYQAGAMVDSVSSSANIVAGSSNVFRVGYGPIGSHTGNAHLRHYAYGVMDELALYQGVLTDDEMVLHADGSGLDLVEDGQVLTADGEGGSSFEWATIEVEY